MKSGAIFDTNRTYRYVLWREWNEGLPKVMFIGLNPSTANEWKDDATLRRTIRLSKQWGFGGLYMLNLYAKVSTNPKLLFQSKDPVGRLNDRYLSRYSKKCKEVIVAWGKMPEEKRVLAVTSMFPRAKCITCNLDGSPRHPLYVKNDARLKRWRKPPLM